jgi:aryl-alcohol dehydrogenase-like predicted oxidoreductase
MIETAPFGRTGHESTRVLFGAAALGSMNQERADAVLETLLEFGINHIDTAEGYGDSELRIGPWMERHRDRFFLATKTRARDGVGARASLERSLERLRVERVDLIQLHHLVHEEDWRTAFAPGGAVEALARARDEGLVSHLGVTGHGTRAPEMHRRSLERFEFASVLAPCNWTMLQDPDYANDFRALVDLCHGRGVAVQTIKSIARRRWDGPPERAFSWYEPLQDPDAIRRAVHFVLARPGLFLNTSSDATLLRATLEAASEPVEPPGDARMRADAEALGITPLFVRGVAEEVGLAP